MLVGIVSALIFGLVSIRLTFSNRAVLQIEFQTELRRCSEPHGEDLMKSNRWALADCDDWQCLAFRLESGVHCRTRPKLSQASRPSTHQSSKWIHIGLSRCRIDG